MPEISDELLARLLERAEQKGRQAAQTQPMYAQQPMYIMQQPTVNRQSNFGFIVLLFALAFIGWWVASNLTFDTSKPARTAPAPVARRAPTAIPPTIAPTTAPVPTPQAPAVVYVIATPTTAPVIEVVPSIAPSSTPQNTPTPTVTAIRAVTATPSLTPVIAPTDVVACINGIEYRNGIQVATPVAAANGAVSGGCW